MVFLQLLSCLGKVTGCHSCLQCTISGVGKKLLDDDERDFSEETKSILREEMSEDNYSFVMPLVAPGDFIKANENPPKSNDVKTSEVNYGWKKGSSGKWKKVDVRKFKQNISSRFKIVILDEGDLLNDRFTLVERLTQDVLKTKYIFPMNDLDYVCKDRKVVAKIMDDLQLSVGKAMPDSYNSDFNMETDESFSRIFFYGIGCVLLEKQEHVSDSEHGPFEVDMPLQDLAVRRLYRKLGARVHFSKEQKVTAIFDYGQGKLFQPGQDGWEDAKLLAKVTCFTLTTAREHLVWTHWLVSNNASREITLNLNPEHPIRRLLSVFTFRTNVVNSEAFDLLMPEFSMLHRACGFTIEALRSVFDASFADSTVFKPFPEKDYNPALQELIDAGRFPYAMQYASYYEIVRGFVRAWLAKAGDASSDAEARSFYEAMKSTTRGQSYELPEFGAEALVDLCSTIVFTVTGYHELIGHVVDYSVFPWRAGVRLTKNDPSRVDLQSLLLFGLISASTSKRMPLLMSPFRNYFGAGGAPSWERELWDGFVAELEWQSEKVRAEEATADFEWKYGDPARYECSVSV